MLTIQGAGNRVTVKSQTLADVLTANPAISRAMVAVRVVHVGKEFAGPDALLDTLNVFTAVGAGVSRGHRSVKQFAVVVPSHHDAVVVIGLHVPTPVWRVRPSPQNYSGWTTRKKAFWSMMGVSKVVSFVAAPTLFHEPSPKAVRD